MLIKQYDIIKLSESRREGADGMGLPEADDQHLRLRVDQGSLSNQRS